MNKRIYLSAPHMGGNELSYINKAFAENWIAPLGPNVDGFENDLCSFNSVNHAAVLSSGTAALHLALIMLGIQQNDEVLCSTFTFSATVNPIIYQGAIPIFIESEKDTWNMCPDALENAIKDRISKGKKPKAIITVHLYGMPAKIEEIISIGKKYEIPVIEDAAESLGSTVNDKKTGTFGLMGVYSFNGNKIITTSGGGALVSNDERLIKEARFLATQARDQAAHYQHSKIGYNYRMSNIVAGIGRGQMEVLNERIQLRRAVFQKYVAELSKFEGITFLEEPKGLFSNRWLTTVVIQPTFFKGKNREDVRLSLENENIESRPLWKPMHKQPVFEHYPYYGNKLSEQLFENGLCLPSCSNMSDEDFGKIIDNIKKTLTK